MKFVIFLLLFSLSVQADINHEKHDFSIEYGMAYHTLKGVQSANTSQARLTSYQNPYWLGSYSYRLGQQYGVKIFGGQHYVFFNDPRNATLKNNKHILNQFGLELLRRSTRIYKYGFILMQQEHPLYYTKAPGVFEVIKEPFFQSGMHFSIGERRRIGLLWGMGLKAYAIFPNEGGSIVTELGAGGEAYARLGWVGLFGTLYQIKGVYQGVSAPNAAVKFAHESLSYCFQINHSF